MLPNPNRPRGITLLAVFHYMGSVVFILLGLIFLFASAIERLNFSLFPNQSSVNVPALPDGIELSWMMIWVATSSAIGFLLGHGLWTLKRWAWIAELLVIGVSMAIQIRSIAALSVDWGQLAFLILWLVYLMQPRVRRAFH